MFLALLASAVVTAAPSLESAIASVAALPGEPRAVSAAGASPDDTPVLTIENSSAFDPAATKRRLVLVGADDTPAAEAVVAAVRWLKTAAPQSIRDRWVVSALPLARFNASDKQALARWVTFQAPDLVAEIGSGGAVHRDDVRVETLPAEATIAALRTLLAGGAGARSKLHDSMADRVRREPLAIARVLAMRYPETPAISYIPAVAWVNTLRLARITGDVSLRDKVVEQTKPWMSGEKKMFGERIQLTAVAGTIVFDEFGSAGSDAAHPGIEQSAVPLADQGAQLAAAEKSPGLAQYGGGWTDDMFMAGAVLARTGRRRGREADLEVAGRLLTAYAERLQRADGLFNHAADGPVAWGRGNGFAAMGLTELLTALPAGHPQRSRVLGIYRRQMAAAKTHQAPDGMWREIVDDPAAYREETATAMLLTAMARGIRLGWIDRSYRPSVDRAWRALAAHIVADGTVIDVCASTGGGPDRKYYFDRPAITGADDRGGAMALMAAMEMHELRGR
jgi:unsaturated rhamnogalacturonyl hydrolase